MSKYNYFVEHEGKLLPLIETGLRGSIDYQYADSNGDMKTYMYWIDEDTVRYLCWPKTIIVLPKEEPPKHEHPVVECKDCDEYSEAIKELEDEDSKRFTSRDHTGQ